MLVSIPVPLRRSHTAVRCVSLSPPDVTCGNVIREIMSDIDHGTLYEIAGLEDNENEIIFHPCMHVLPMKIQ